MFQTRDVRVWSGVLQGLARPDPDVEVGVHMWLFSEDGDCEGRWEKSVLGEVVGDAGAEGEFLCVGEERG